MAIYHLSIKTVARSGGRSATAAAAYRSGEKIADRASGQTFDYARKRGVEHTEIVLPTKAALQDINWARDRQALWNAAEGAEKRKDSRVAREYASWGSRSRPATQRSGITSAQAIHGPCSSESAATAKSQQTSPSSRTNSRI